MANLNEASPFIESGRLPPQNIEAEESVLGGVLLENRALDEIEFLRAEDFYRSKHGKIFEAMRTLNERGDPVDLVTLAGELKATGDLDAVGGQPFLTHLAGRVPTAANIKYYARIVHDKSLLRRLIGAATEIAGSGYEPSAKVEEMLDGAEAKILEIGQSKLSDNLRRIDEVVKDTFKHINRMHEHQSDVTGVPTGFTDIDRVLAGLQPTDLIILAARPSMGKTSLALNIASNAALHYHVPVAVFSLEMGREQLAMRLLSSEAGIPSHKMRTGLFSDSQMTALIDAASRLSDAPVHIDDTAGIRPLELKAKARRIARLHKDAPMGLIVVDYLQLMTAPRQADNRAQEVAEISRSLKILAKELKWPVLALSQLNRGVEQRTDKRPMLSDLRESGAIEQDADVVCFIYRDDRYKLDSSEYDGTAEFIIAKNRNGPVDTVKLHFNRSITKFENLYQGAVPAGVAGYGGGGEDPDAGVAPAF